MLGMPGFKTEAIVLRSIRYAEADRVLHLYSEARGRLNAIAKGARRPRSRFGGRLEPFFRLDLVLHEGRGELATVTGAHTVAAHANLRDERPGARRGGARLRLRAAAAGLERGESGRLQPAVPVPGAARRRGAAQRALAVIPEIDGAAGHGDGARLPAEAGARGGVLARS